MSGNYNSPDHLHADHERHPLRAERLVPRLRDTGTYTLSVRDVTPPQSGFVEGDTDLADDATTRGEVEVDGPVARGTIFEPDGPAGDGDNNNYYTFDYDWFRGGTQGVPDLPDRP